MVNLSHIAEGWGKSLGWLEITPENQMLSNSRMAICAKCEFAEESKILKLFRGNARELDAIYCSKCPSKIKCPVNEKTLVTDEKCPKEKW